jgi:HupE / UreJ protein
MMSAASAHVVQQIFVKFTAGDGRWQAEVTMDAGYAWPAGRDDPLAPQPTLEWLEARTPSEFRLLRTESESLLRTHFDFRGGAASLPWTCRFPDFDSFPPAFPELPGRFAFLTVRIDGPLPDARAGVPLTVHERTGRLPNFVFKTGDDRYATLRPGEFLTLAEGTGARAPARPALWHFGWEGFRHVLPLGWDHILFILAMYLLDRRLRPVVLQSLCFTAAHTVTLGLATMGIVQVPATVVEPLIAFSIAGAAFENLFTSKVRARRLLLIFAFGLVHGLGFGGALAAVLQSSGGVIPLLAANAGVECAQIVILLAAAGLFALLPRSADSRTAAVLNVLLVATGLSVGIARIAG